MKKIEWTEKDIQQVLTERKAENAALRKLIEALHKDSQKQKKRGNSSTGSFQSTK